MWRLGGGTHRVLGGSCLNTKGVYWRLFLDLRNLRNFEFATENEAIVDAPWVCLCVSCRQLLNCYGKN